MERVGLFIILLLFFRLSIGHQYHSKLTQKVVVGLTAVFSKNEFG